MSYFDISGATFDENLRKLETSDPAHADVFNALLGQLINNDVALKEAVTKFAASKNEQALFRTCIKMARNMEYILIIMM